MKINAKSKGNRAEREQAKQYSKDFEIECFRNRRSGAHHWYPSDIIFKVPQSHILYDAVVEIKDRKNWSVLNWLKKNKDEKQSGLHWVEMTSNQEGWYIAMPREQWIRILIELNGYRKECQ